MGKRTLGDGDHHTSKHETNESLWSLLLDPQLVGSVLVLFWWGSLRPAPLTMNIIGNIAQGLRNCWADHFSRKFLPKRPPLRQITYLPIFYQVDYKTRQTEVGLDYGPPRAHLNEAKLIFREGKWEDENSSSPQQSQLQTSPSPLREKASEILEKNKALLEENNYLKLQLELLMDMLIETTVQLRLLEKKVQVSGRHLKTKQTGKLLMLES
uniref:Chibby family member 3 n=1 Tax=Dromaius novaehollandiae TaxID=8790 RepID=A0A8C4PAL3_DRONO|nr:protein chibby homolog 3 [Dromaius novaehollandiae]